MAEQHYREFRYWDVIHSAAVILLWSYIFSYLCYPLFFISAGCSRCALQILLSIIGLGILLARNYLKVDPSNKAVLITGCDTGFGHTLALHLQKQGYFVFAGCLDETSQGAKILRSESADQIRVIQLNVTSNHDIDKAVSQVKDTLKDKDLWAVVNNAGVTTPVEFFEWMTLHEIESFVNVNVLGTAKVTKAFLPLLRKCRGRIINVSSIAGLIATPLISVYSMTKFAMEGLSESLRKEMKSFGVNVILVEPGNYSKNNSLMEPDNFKKSIKSTWQSLNEEIKSAYTEEYTEMKCIKQQLKIAETASENMDLAIESMTNAVSHTFPQARYQPSSTPGKLFAWIFPLLPEVIVDGIYQAIEFLAQKF